VNKLEDLLPVYWGFSMEIQALKKGASTIYVEYGRPWKGGEKGEWTFRLPVVVK